MPVCGPAPRRYEVRGAPDGCRTVNEILAVPVWAMRVGVKPDSANVRAGWIVGTFGREEPEQPVSRTRAAHARRPGLIAGRLPSRCCGPSALLRDLGDATRGPGRGARRGGVVRAGIRAASPPPARPR